MNGLDLIYQDYKTSDTIFIEPLDFIHSQNKFKHIVLYYDDIKFGKKIQFEFIKKGLSNKENCIYTIPYNEDTSIIENEMDKHGIDSQYYIKKGLLTIFKIPDLLVHPKGFLDGSKDVLDKMLSGKAADKPFRLTARFIDKLNLSMEIEANMILEKYYHDRFDNYNGSVLCSYDVNICPFSKNNHWLETILQNHHSAIFITNTDGKGIAFDI